MKFSGSCDFQKPSQNLVNAYKTVNGLPEFSDYNKADYNANTDKVDPRLYHTVALPGVPYKYDKKIFLMNHGLVIKLYTACILL